MRVRLIEDYGPDEMIRITGRMAGSEHSADMAISTAHKATGRDTNARTVVLALLDRAELQVPSQLLVAPTVQHRL